jgi:hypothetical protein
MSAKTTSIMMVMLMLSMLITACSLLGVNSTDKHTAEKKDDVSAQHHPPRTVWVGTTDLRTTGKERPATKWDYFEKFGQPTAQRVNLALKYLPPAGPTAVPMDPVICHSSSGGGAWFVSCYADGCLVTITGSNDGSPKPGTAISCDLD